MLNRKTVSLLLTDAVFSYTPGDGKTVVGVGDIITAQGFRYEVAASAASDAHIETPGGVKLYVLTNADGSIHQAQFGVVADGGTDDTAAMLKFGASTVSRHKRVSGNPVFTSEITFNIDDHVEGDGYENVLDGSGISSHPGTGGIIMTTGEAGLVQISDLAASPSADAIQITLADASDVEPGDWICLYNPTDNSWLPSPHPATYREGEWCQVFARDTGTNVVTLFKSLWRGYTAANMEVYRLRTGSPSFKNFRVKCPPNERPGLFIDCALNPVVENVWSEGSEYAVVRLMRCIHPRATLYLTGSKESGTPSNEYGLQLSSVVGGEIHGSYSAERHGISFGNADFVCCVPNRETKVFADTHSPVNLSLDVGGHGCSEGLVVIGGTHTGLSTGGANMRYVGSTFRIGPRSSGTAQSCVAYSEGKGGDFVFDGCIFDNLTTNTNSSLIHLFLQAGNDEGPRFHFNNCIFKDAGGNAYPIRCYLSGTTVAPEIYVNGGWVSMSAFSRMVQVNYVSGTTAVGAVVVRNVDGRPSNATLIGNSGATITKQIADKGMEQRGVVSVSLSASSTGTASVTFDTAYAAAPVVSLTPDDTLGNFSATCTRTTTGLTVRVRDIDGTTRTGSVNVSWVAAPA